MQPIKVILERVKGLQSRPDNIPDDEKYWLLIGAQGRIVSTDAPSFLRDYHGEDVMLVQLDVDVLALGLHCHNDVPNSLWFRKSDLAFMEN